MMKTTPPGIRLKPGTPEKQPLKHRKTMEQKRWYECRVRYEKAMDDGTEKKVNESYLVDALSFTEAEARIINETRLFAPKGEMEVTAIRKENLAEVHLYPDGANYYCVRLCFVTLNEKTGREKKTYASMLVNADTLQEAKDRIVEQMKGTLSDYRIAAAIETGLIDVYPYAAPAGAPSPCTTKS